ncbi:O-antigen ligase family protein [Flavobacterium sp. 25HG05S-40]|uniref:O-antigen ligase family protein n=1 Tax=Flavobacterium sp. 25HG05S-40 TaxID=3458682 RepID=UPI004044221B
MSDTWIEKLYFGFLLLLPLVFCSTTIDPVLIPRQILLTTFMLVIVIVVIAKKIALSYNFRNPLFYAFGSFIVLNYISMYQSYIAGESHAPFSKLLLLFSFFVITTLLLYHNVLKENQLVTAVVFFGLITLLFPLYDIYEKTLEGQHLLRQIALISGTSGNKNLLSSILFLTLPFYCIGLQLGKKIKLVSVVGIVLTLFVLATIRTRVVLIACFIFFMLLVLYKIKRRFAIKKRYVIGSGFIFILLLFLSYTLFFKSKITQYQTSHTNVTEHYIARLFSSKTLESRVLFWKNSLKMAKEHSVAGVGLGNWQVQFPKYGLNEFTEVDIINGESTLQRPHNDFIWILSETGIFGLLAYLILFGVVFYQLYHLIRKAPSLQEKWKFYFILCGLIGYIIISFFDFPYERIEHQVLLMLLFALVASTYSKSIQTQEKHRSWLVYLLLIPIGYSFLVSFNRFSGEQHAVKMYAAKNNKNWSETIFESKKAANYFYPLDNTSMSLSWYEGIGHFNENRPEESEACFTKAYQLTPYNIQVMTNLASTYQINGKTEEAEALFKKALKISNRFDEAKLNLAALYFNQKEYDKAYVTINEVAVTSKNPKYQTYLVPILNQKINAYLKTATDKAVIANLVKNITTKEALLRLFFEARKQHTDFETYLGRAQFSQ